MSDQSINGNNRSNIIISGSGDDTINAGGGNDLVISGAGDDTINGGRGNDIIISGFGDDTVNGGSGNDIIISGAGNDTVNGGSGNDLIISGSGDDVISGGSGNDVIISGSGDDTVSGGSGNDYINSGSGDDQISGGSGSDIIVSGTGDDTIEGNSGSDTIISGDGNDTVEGNNGHDLIITGSGDDFVQGNDGHDILITGDGNDIVDGGNGDDVIISGSGNDTVSAGQGDDIVLTGSGNDSIDTGAGSDWVHAGSGEDQINIGLGDNYVNGGSDNDIAIFDGPFSDYTLTIDAPNVFLVVNNTTGAENTLVNVELLRFSDIDIDPNNPIVNTDPIATNDSVSLNEDSVITIDVLANDTDLDGDSLSVIAASAANGSVVINTDGTVTYTPNEHFNGQDTISYEISDGNGGTDTAEVTVTVNAVNDGPVATNDTVSLNEDSVITIDVLANDTDLDGDSLSVITASAANGSVVINTDGTVTYTPNEHFNGQDTISYEISDGNGGTDTAEVTVTVNAVNDGPIATNDSASLNEDSVITIDVLANDSDIDGDNLSVIAASAANGSVVINTDGTVTYTPNEHFNGQDTISYEISDGNGGTDTAEVTVTVNAVNDGPVATNDTVSLNEDSVITIDVLANDTDLDGDNLSVIAASAANGSVVINTDGTVTYTPNEHFNGQDTISYEISDGNGGTDTAEVTVTVNAVNDGPIATNDSASLNEDSVITIDVLANDSDIDGDNLSVIAASAANGSVVINTDGTVTYTPNEHFNGQDTISYEISDGNGGTDTAEVTVTVNAVNDGPVATNDTVSLNEDSVITIDVLANDTDLDGDNLSVIAASAANGSVVINTDGTVTYTPNEHFNGQDTISYEISDGNGGTDTAEVTVTVNAVNDGPIATNDTVSLNEDSVITIDVLANDTDLDGDNLSVITASAANGSVVINTDGTVTYTPNEHFNGQDTISYEISDGNGGTDTAEVSVTVNAVNDNPLAQDDVASVNEDGSVIIDVLANDSDIENDVINVVSATATNGSVTLNSDGTVTYIPNSGFNGQDTISYQVSDNNGGFDNASVSVNVIPGPTNNDPIAVDDAMTVDAGTNTVIANFIFAFPNVDNTLLTANDSDPDGDSLTLIEVNGQALNGQEIIVQGSNGGTFKILPTGYAELDTTSGFDNVPAGDSVTTSVTYTISDGNGGTDTATVTVTVNGMNETPVAVADSATLDMNDTAVIDVLANDTDANGDTLVVTSATAANGSVTINNDGTLSYTPNLNFSGLDTINYSISDGFDTASTSVAVTVNAPNLNTAPVANDDAYTVTIDTPATFDVLTNDQDVDGDSLSVTFATANSGSVVINSDGTLSYTPSQGFTGTDTVSYTISDGMGGTDTATVNVTVNPAPGNSAPIAVDDAMTVDAGTNTVIANFIFAFPSVVNTLLTANDSDPDGDSLTLIEVNGQALNGQEIIVQGSNGGTFKILPTGYAELDTTSGFDNVPAGDSVTTSVTYTISDGNGGTDTATVTVTVNGMNETPVAVADSATLDMNDTAVIDVLANDTDANGDTLVVTSATAANGSVTINNDGTLSYTPNLNFSGLDTINYSISDGFDTASTSVAVTVNAPNLNTAPVANDDAYTVTIDTPATFDVLTNDQDVDGDSLSVTFATANSGSVVINSDGTLSYTPSQGFTGTDTVSYTISDGMGGTDTATVNVTVNPAPGNSAPIAVDDAMTVDAGTNTVIANFIFAFPSVVNTLLTANDSDPDGDSLTLVEVNGQALNGQQIIVQGSNGGTFKILPTGYAELDTTSGFDNVPVGDSVTTSVTYTISDGNGGTDSATVTVTVNGMNDVPNAVDDNFTTTESAPVVLDILANDNDVLAVSSIDTSNLQGSLLDNGDGTFTYDANQQFDYLNDGETATDFFEYTVDDGLGGLDTAQVMITLQGATSNSTSSAQTTVAPDSSLADGADDGSNDYMV